MPNDNNLGFFNQEEVILNETPSTPIIVIETSGGYYVSKLGVLVNPYQLGAINNEQYILTLEITDNAGHHDIILDSAKIYQVQNTHITLVKIKDFKINGRNLTTNDNLNYTIVFDYQRDHNS